MPAVEYQFRPLSSWPGTRTRERRRATFKAGYARTLVDLERELLHLGARTAVVEAECGEEDIRQDGRIRSNARMRGPGIIVSFQSRHGPLRYPCDTYTDWTDNLRAIVLAMEALRAVDRYGVTKRGEQYTGWKQLPGGEPAGPEWETAEAAARFICVTAWGPSRIGPDYIESMIDPAGHKYELDIAYRAAAKKAHPDAGGSNELMSKVNRARDFIAKGGHR
jgi:hypothetical protein